jgi:hypothetical protein
MLLLRPYAIYQITRVNSANSLSEKANNLLQRLVKKKDDHHTEAWAEAVEVKRFKVLPRLPVMMLSSLIRNISRSLVSQRLSASKLFSTVFKVSASNHCYRLQSRFQI